MRRLIALVVIGIGIFLLPGLIEVGRTQLLMTEELMPAVWPVYEKYFHLLEQISVGLVKAEKKDLEIRLDEEGWEDRKIIKIEVDDFGKEREIIRLYFLSEDMKLIEFKRSIYEFWDRFHWRSWTKEVAISKAKKYLGILSVEVPEDVTPSAFPWDRLYSDGWQVTWRREYKIGSRTIPYQGDYLLIRISEHYGLVGYMDTRLSDPPSNKIAFSEEEARKRLDKAAGPSFDQEAGKIGKKSIVLGKLLRFGIQVYNLRNISTSLSPLKTTIVFYGEYEVKSERKVPLTTRIENFILKRYCACNTDPPNRFLIRIDAETGEILHGSLRWHVER